jgi:hypothetical protein
LADGISRTGCVLNTTITVTTLGNSNSFIIVLAAPRNGISGTATIEFPRFYKKFAGPWEFTRFFTNQLDALHRSAFWRDRPASVPQAIRPTIKKVLLEIIVEQSHRFPDFTAWYSDASPARPDEATRFPSSLSEDTLTPHCPICSQKDSNADLVTEASTSGLFLSLSTPRVKMAVMTVPHSKVFVISLQYPRRVTRKTKITVSEASKDELKNAIPSGLICCLKSIFED